MRKGISRLIVTLFLIAITGSCLVSSAGKKTLTFGLSTEPANLNPFIVQGQAKRTVLLNIYRGLVSFNSPTGKLVNELARSYTLAPDNKTYTFVLRNAKFQNGDPVTANDVKFTFEKILDVKTGASYRTEMSVIDKMEVINKKTLKITLKTPCKPFIQYLAIPEAGIVSEKWVAKHSNLSAEPMGAGPFQFVSWDKGQNIKLKKFKGYYKKGFPKVDMLKFNFYADDDARTNAIRSGDADIIEFVPWKDIKILLKEPNLKTVSQFGPFMEVLFNVNYKPLSNPKVRQAISYAIDRKKILNTAFNGRGRPMYGPPIQKGTIGYNPKLDNYFSHSLTKAKALLAEAGYGNGFKLRLLSTSTYAMHQQTAVSVQDDLKKIGLDVTLDLPDWANRNKKVLEGDYDALIGGTASDYTDPDWLANHFHGGQANVNRPYGFNDPEINKLFDQGKTLPDNERVKTYGQLYLKLLEASPAAFCTWRDQSYTMKKNVTGFINLPGPLTFYSGITLDRTSIK
jgi:glutathione transport system substrate-binding protein